MRRREDQGAAAVEFALVAPILITLILGMLDWGLYFNNSLSLRQSIREASRMGAVTLAAASGWPANTACSSVSATAYASRSGKVACYAQTLVNGTTGTLYVKVIAPNGYAAIGNPILVCGLEVSAKPIGLVPVPNGGQILSYTQLSVETVNPAVSTRDFYADSLPSGVAWPSTGPCSPSS